ncbi:MAG: hypothetical protein KDD45_10250, partial [Bdellovibrionales bacterium]|nr:hypothetical protein [Bdellovibrionales bacterium]
NWLLMAEYRTWKPSHPDINKYWNTRYHRDALPELMKAVYYVRDQDFSKIKKPSLVFYTENDTVIFQDEVKKKFLEIVSDKKKIVEIPSPAHVLAGVLTSPQTTQMVITEMTNWLESIGVR